MLLTSELKSCSFFVQANIGCRLHEFHQRAADFCLLLLLKRDIQLVKEARGSTLLLLHHFLRCVCVEGNLQQPESRLNAGEVIQSGAGGAEGKGVIRFNIYEDYRLESSNIWLFLQAIKEAKHHGLMESATYSFFINILKSFCN